MSIATEITRLQQAKADIKTAIENKGVTVPSDATLDDYADLVDSISGGGGSVDWEALFKTLIGDTGASTELVIPEGITKVKQNGVYKNSSVTKVVLPSTYTTPGNYDGYVVGECSALTTLELGGLEKISESMFRNNTALTSVILPASVAEIRAYAFSGCTNLATCIIERTSGVVSLNYNVTQVFPSATQFYVPDDLLASYQAHAKWGADQTRLHKISDLPT